MNTVQPPDTLVSVRNLDVTFRIDRHTTFEAVKGVCFDIPPNARWRWSANPAAASR